MTVMQWVVVLLAIPAAIFGVLMLLGLPLQIQRVTKRMRDLESAQKAAREWSSAELKEMQNALGQVAALQKRVRELEQRLEEVALHGGDSRPYQQAIRMVERGATAEDLMADCELSPAEARLILSLHRGETG